MGAVRIVRLLSNDVFKNLAAEEALFTSLPAGSRALLFYVNTAAVVVGRTQNPFFEADIASAEEQSASIARRRSGGGTVVHDEGNLNFCFMGPRAAHDPNANAQLLVRVLGDAFGVRAGLSERGDILVAGRKVSGAAYRIASDRAYHHGTLLVHSDLDRLRGLLRSPLRDQLCVTGAASVPAPVANLSDFAADITIPSLISAVAERFGHVVASSSRNDASSHGVGNKAEVEELTEELVAKECSRFAAEHRDLCSTNWVYGQIPRFSYSLMHESEPNAAHGSLRAKQQRLVFYMSKGARIEAVKRFPSTANVLDVGAYPRQGFGQLDDMLTPLLHESCFGKYELASALFGLSKSCSVTGNVARQLSEAIPNRYISGAC
jgi:lipoate---protein ligase